MTETDIKSRQYKPGRIVTGVSLGLTIIFAFLLGIALSFAFDTAPLTAYAVPVLLLLLGSFVFLLFHHGLWILVLALAIRSSLEAISGVGLLGGLNLASLLALGILVLAVSRLAIARKFLLALNDRTFPYLLLTSWGIFSGFVINSNFWSIAQGSAEIARMLSNISIFWLVLAFVKDRKDFYRMLVAIVLSGLLPLAAGFLGLLQDSGTSIVWGIPGLVRIKGLFAHPNNYAHYLIIIGLCAYILFRWSKLEWVHLQKPLLILLAVILVSLAMTFSRSALIGVGVAIFLIGVKNTRTLLTTLLVLAILGLLFAWFFPSFVEYTFTQTLTSMDPSESTLASRFWIWEHGYKWFTSSPVVGNGPGSFVKLVRIDAHNDYLRILVEYGIPGLLFFGWVSIIQFMDGWRLMITSRRFQKEAERDHRAESAQLTLLDSRKGYILARVFLTLLITIMVMAAGSNIFNFPVLQWYIFAMWGLVVVYHEYLNRQ